MSLNFIAGEGKRAEEDVNKLGPGEAIFIFCDVRKEDDIKVNIFVAFLYDACQQCKHGKGAHGSQFRLLKRNTWDMAGRSPAKDNCNSLFNQKKETNIKSGCPL